MSDQDQPRGSVAEQDTPAPAAPDTAPDIVPGPRAKRRARLIMNPISGDDEPNPMKLPDIVAALDLVDIRADISFTKADESPSEIAKQAIEEGYEMVVVGGGDGTVSEVAKGMINAPIPLGIIPIGTFNNIARSLKIPTDVTEACQVLAQGNRKKVDVGVANDTNYFFEAAGVGLDAALFPLGEEIKGGRWGRLFQAAKLTLDFRPARMTLELDRSVREARVHKPGTRQRFWLNRRRGRLGSGELRLRALLLTVANGPYYGTGFTVAPDAVIDDGLLTITIFRNFSKLELLRHFMSISKGQYNYSPKLEEYIASEIRISSSRKLPVHIDGKPLGELPVVLKCLHHALEVIVPSAETPEYKRKDDPSPPVSLPVETDDSGSADSSGSSGGSPD